MTEVHVPSNVEETTAAIRKMGLSRDLLATNRVKEDRVNCWFWVQFSELDGEGERHIEVWAYISDIPLHFLAVAKPKTAFCYGSVIIDEEMWMELFMMCEDYERAMATTAA